MTDVLFGQSYFLRFDQKLWDAAQPYPPLGTLYAASIVRDDGHEVALFDSMLADSEEGWSAELERRRPRVAVLYEDSFNYLSKMCLLRMRQAGFTMLEQARRRGCVTIAAGSDASDHPQEYLAAGADVVILGEGETTLRETLQSWRSASSQGTGGLGWLRAGDVNGIKGLCYRDESGQVVRTAPRPIVRDLDALPFPAWDLVDVERYRRIWRTRHGYHSMNLVTTRGCPYHCNWCAKPIYGQRYTVRSPENVVAEMRWLIDRYGPDHLCFADDIFGLKPGWIERFGEIVSAGGRTVPFKCLLRVDLVNPRVVHALKAAGCRTVWVGAESGSQTILDAMEKGTTVEQIYGASKLLHEAGIELGFFLQFGYPGETRADIEKTLQMVRECRPDDIGISVSYPLPGTPFHDRVKAQLGTKQNWVDSNDLAMMYRGTYSTAFYRALHTTVHKEFRARRASDALGRLARRPWLLRGSHLRQTAALLYHRATLPAARIRMDRLALSNADGPPLITATLAPGDAAVRSEQTD